MSLAEKAIFECETAHAWLREITRQNQSKRGYKAEMALAAGCQRSYLSQVLAGRALLQPEHAIGLAQFWTLPALDREYWLELVHLERAGSDSLKAFHAERIREIRSRAFNLASRFQAPELDSRWQDLYYSDWIYSALHVLASCPEYQHAEAMARKFGLSVAIIEQKLEQLVRAGLLASSGAGTRKRWRPLQPILHVAEGSIANLMNHTNWRQHAVRAIGRPESSGRDVHYTAVYSLSRADLEQLRTKVRDWIAETRKIVAPSQEEEIIVFLCDLFQP